MDHPATVEEIQALLDTNPWVPPNGPMPGEEEDLAQYEEYLADVEDLEVERAHYMMRHGHF